MIKTTFMTVLLVLFMGQCVSATNRNDPCIRGTATPEMQKYCKRTDTRVRCHDSPDGFMGRISGKKVPGVCDVGKKDPLYSEAKRLCDQFCTDPCKDDYLYETRIGEDMKGFCRKKEDGRRGELRCRNGRMLVQVPGESSTNPRRRRFGEDGPRRHFGEGNMTITKKVTIPGICSVKPEDPLYEKAHQLCIDFCGGVGLTSSDIRRNTLQTDPLFRQCKHKAMAVLMPRDRKLGGQEMSALAGKVHDFCAITHDRSEIQKFLNGEIIAVMDEGGWIRGVPNKTSTSPGVQRP